MTTIAQIAKQIKMNPKTARRILRNTKNVPNTVNSKHWQWNTPEAKRVVAILRTA